MSARQWSFCLPLGKAVTAAKKSSVANRFVSSCTGRVLLIRPPERVALKAVWAAITDRRLFGQNIMLQIFKTKPFLKNLFKLGHVHDDITMAANPLFIKHSGSFSMFLHVSLTRLLAGEFEELIVFTHQVGSAHSTFREVSFDAEYWLLFKASVLDQLKPYYAKANIKPQFAHDVWNRVLMFLIMEMKTAFNLHTVARLSCPINADMRAVVYEHLIDNYQGCEEQDGYHPSSGLQPLRNDAQLDRPHRTTSCPELRQQRSNNVPNTTSTLHVNKSDWGLVSKLTETYIRERTKNQKQDFPTNCDSEEPPTAAINGGGEVQRGQKGRRATLNKSTSVRRLIDKVGVHRTRRSSSQTSTPVCSHHDLIGHLTEDRERKTELD